MEDITKIVKSSKDYDLWIRSLIKSVIKTNEILKKKKKSGCLCMLSGILSASLSGNMLTDKGVIKAGDGIIQNGDEVIWTKQDFYCHLVLWLTLRYKYIIKISLNVKVFIQEIMYQTL